MSLRFPLFLGGIALLFTACAGAQQEIRHSTPTEYSLLRGEQVNTPRQNANSRDINVLTGFGNLALNGGKGQSFRLSSTMEAPTIDGVSLKLEQLLQLEGLLIAAYGNEDGEPKGAISLFDIRNPEKPVLRSELLLPNLSIQTLAVEGSMLYFAGFCSDPLGSVIGRISFQELELVDDLQLAVLDAKGIQGLAILPERIVVLDREASTLISLQKKDFLTLEQTRFSHMGSISNDADSLWAISTDPTRITQLDGSLQKIASMDRVYAVKGESFYGQIKTEQDMVLASLGSGVSAFCKADQKALFHIPAVIRADLPAKRTLSRAAGLSRGLLLTTNDEAGVYVYQVTAKGKDGACQAQEVRLHGYLDLGKQFHAETLSLQNGLLAVGDSLGNLLFLKVPSGTHEPDSADEEEAGSRS